MSKYASCPIEDVMQFACALEVGSIFTLKMLINREGALLRKSSLKRATPNPAVAMPRPPSEDGPVL